jgi:hypothetical protein
MVCRCAGGHELQEAFAARSTRINELEARVEKHAAELAAALEDRAHLQTLAQKSAAAEAEVKKLKVCHKPAALPTSPLLACICPASSKCLPFRRKCFPRARPQPCLLLYFDISGCVL